MFICTICTHILHIYTAEGIRSNISIYQLLHDIQGTSNIYIYDDTSTKAQEILPVCRQSHVSNGFTRCRQIHVQNEWNAFSVIS